MTYRGNNVEWLDSVSLTSIINVSIGSGGSGCVSRNWQSQYGTIDMSRYNIMWYAQYIDKLKNKKTKKLKALSYWFHCIEGGNNKGGVTHKWHSLYVWLGARKTYSSALAMDLRLSCINPWISSLAWVWWVITRKYGEHSSLLCENAVLINMTDRAVISLGMRPANETCRYNVKTSLMCWAQHT